MYQKYIKRGFDFILALIASIILSPDVAVIPQQETAVPMRGKQHPVQRAQTAAQEEERWM